MTLHVSPAKFRSNPVSLARPVGLPLHDDKDPAALQAIGTLSHFVRNQSIYGEGEPAAYSFKILSGAVRLFKLLPDGRRQIAGFRMAGDYFGLDGDGEYSLSAESLSDLSVVRYARHHLRRLEDEGRDVRHCVMNMLRRDLLAAQTHLIMLGRQTARERVASFLLQLAERNDLSDGDLVPIPMGRQDMADYLGLTIETVCRAISELKRLKIIAVPDRHNITLRNMDALQSLADGEE